MNKNCGTQAQSRNAEDNTEHGGAGGMPDTEM